MTEEVWMLRSCFHLVAAEPMAFADADIACFVEETDVDEAAGTPNENLQEITFVVAVAAAVSEAVVVAAAAPQSSAVKSAALVASASSFAAAAVVELVATAYVVVGFSAIS